jgi:hypothetical protein
MYFYLLQRLIHLIQFKLSLWTHVFLTSLFSLFNLYHIGKKKLKPGVHGQTFGTRVNYIETMERSHMDSTLSSSPSAVTLFTCPDILPQTIQFTGMLVLITFASNKCFGLAEIQWRGTQQ